MKISPYSLLFLLHISCLIYGTIAKDPCASKTEIPFIDKRDNFNKVSLGVKLINDRFLKEGWYGTGDDRTFLDAAPGFQQCGTLYPIWRQKKEGDISTMCIQTSKNPCSLKFKITTMTCGTEEIFNLKRSQVRNSAYCFGWRGGAGPPVFEETPVVDTILVHKDEFESQLEFRCNFNKHEDDVFYRTHWLVDGRHRITTDPGRWEHGDVVQKQALTEEALRNETGVATFGFEVRCSVRVSYEVDKPASTPVWSKSHFIGIKVSKNVLLLKEGQSDDVTVQLTAPFGCGNRTDVANDCVLNIEAYNIENPGNCKLAALLSSLCGTTIKQSEWMKAKPIKVFGKILSDYGQSSHVTKLKLKTEVMLPSRLWSNYDLGSITIQLAKNTSVIEKKNCYATNDPHMKTFDGRRYEHQFDGTFTMYKHNTLPVEVQLQTASCNNGQNAWCNCGIAVRAGKTVFEFNRCPGYTNYWTAEYTLCEDGGDVLQVKRKGKSYEIYLPTGGKVDVSLYHTFLNVYIYPSVQDVHNSAGLCGKLSGVCSDDFVMRDGSYSTDRTADGDCTVGYRNWKNLLTQFSNSWRVRAAENLFKHENHHSLSSWPKSSTFCSCTTDEVKADESLHEKVECAPTKARDICKSLSGFSEVPPSKCSIQKRRKRRSLDSTSGDHKRLRRVAESWTNGWTEDTARDHCEQLFQNSKSVQSCGNVSGVETTGSIDNCVLDILLTGTTTFGSFSIDTVRSKCLREVVVNPVLRENTSVANQSVFEMVVAEACSNDCSGQGKCLEGECVCDTHYGGDDCSVDLRLPPELAEVENDGHCDTSRDTCHVISIWGETFLENGTSCLIEEIKVDRISQESKGKHTTMASIQSINHIQCHLPTGSDDIDFVRAYRISVSNTGEFYSKSVGVMVYDGTCVKGHINGTDFKWTVEGPYHVNEGKCVANKQKHPGEACLHCDVTEASDMNRDNTGSFPVIPVVAGIAGVIVLAILMATIYVCKKKRYRKKEDGNAAVLTPLTELNVNPIS